MPPIAAFPELQSRTSSGKSSPALLNETVPEPDDRSVDSLVEAGEVELTFHTDSD
jgi:hypothetical protein